NSGIAQPRGGPRSGNTAAARTVGPVGGTLVIGPKKLSTIRHELQQALASTGDDPIRWLEERMAVPECQGTGPSGESEVLQSLYRMLEAGEKATKQKRGASAKK